MVKNPNNCETEIRNTVNGDAQPNGVDLRVSKIFKYSKEDDYFLLSDNEKHVRRLEEVEKNSDGYYVLDEGYYVLTFENEISVGANECGWVYPRSTLMRNGLIIHSCVYDSGYVGTMLSGLTVNCKAYIAPHTRVAQFVTVDADANGTYNGQYQNKAKLI